MLAKRGRGIGIRGEGSSFGARALRQMQRDTEFNDTWGRSTSDAALRRRGEVGRASAVREWGAARLLALWRLTMRDAAVRRRSSRRHGGVGVTASAHFFPALKAREVAALARPALRPLAKGLRAFGSNLTRFEGGGEFDLGLEKAMSGRGAKQR